MFADQMYPLLSFSWTVIVKWKQLCLGLTGLLHFSTAVDAVLCRSIVSFLFCDIAVSAIKMCKKTIGMGVVLSTAHGVPPIVNVRFQRQ